MRGHQIGVGTLVSARLSSQAADRSYSSRGQLARCSLACRWGGTAALKSNDAIALDWGGGAAASSHDAGPLAWGPPAANSHDARPLVFGGPSADQKRRRCE